MSPTSFERKLHEERYGNCPLLRFNHRSFGWKPTASIARLHSDRITD